MSKLHDPDLNDNEKNLYYFPEKIVSRELINALITHYKDIDGELIDTEITRINLVPADPYFIDTYSSRNWVYIEKITITQQQVDRYLTLFNITGLSFLEYMEITLED